MKPLKERNRQDTEESHSFRKKETRFMSQISRRQFVRNSAAFGAVATMGFPGIIRGQGLNEKLQVGFVAVGGRASGHTKAAHQEGCQCVAFAEVDKTCWDGVLDKDGWSGA